MPDTPVRKRRISPTLLFLPAFSLLIFFWCVPLVPGSVLALRAPARVGSPAAWPSLVNYSRLLGEKTFRHNLLLSLFYVVGVVGTATPFAYAAANLQEAMPRIEIEVYTRDFGDNCYVINMKGKFSLREFTFPATNLNACLRNGNALVFIGLGGNYTPEHLRKEFDHFLSEMDAKTAFFRE